MVSYADMTIYEYLEKNICPSWGIKLEEVFETNKKDMRLIKSNFISDIRKMEATRVVDEGYEDPAEEHVLIMFHNTKYKYTFDVKVRYGGGTPGCCATYFLTYTLAKAGKYDSDSDSDSDSGS